MVKEASETSFAEAGNNIFVDLRNIRRWKKAFDSLELNCDAKSRVSIRNNSAKKFRFSGAGQKSTVINHLKDFLKESRGKDFSLSTKMLVIECQRFDLMVLFPITPYVNNFFCWPIDGTSLGVVKITNTAFATSH
jgi:hypothetical protein